MRKIDPTPTRDNVRRLAPAAALLACACLLGACGGRQDTGGQAATGDRRHDAAGCPAVVTDRGLQDFLALAARADGESGITLEDCNRLAETDLYASWRESFYPTALRAPELGRHFFIAMVGRDRLPDQQRSKRPRADMVLNFEQTFEYRREIADFVAAFIRDETVCRSYELLQEFLPPQEMPDSLHVAFMVGLPEIQLYEGVLLFDASLAWAGGSEQTAHAIAATLYKHATFIDGPSPGLASGPDILLHCLRLIRNDAVVTVIDRLEEKAFDQRHGRLLNQSSRPHDMLAGAHRTLLYIDQQLTRLRGLDETTDRDWTNIFNYIVGAQSWRATAWYMATTIVEQLGRPRLIESARRMPDFIAAYQEASLRAPRRTDAEPGSPPWLRAHPPSFSEENVAWLDRELRRLFP